MIYEFRLRDGIRGVSTKHVEATDLVDAERKARLYCSRKPGAEYIANSAAPWLITVDDAHPVADAPPVVVEHKPSNAEQKERLKKTGAARMAGTGVGSTPKAEGGRIGA
jgi:hypothetical protein